MITEKQKKETAYYRYLWRIVNGKEGNDKIDWEWAEYELLNEQECEPYFHYYIRTENKI